MWTHACCRLGIMQACVLGQKDRNRLPRTYHQILQPPLANPIGSLPNRILYPTETYKDMPKSFTSVPSLAGELRN